MQTSMQFLAYSGRTVNVSFSLRMLLCLLASHFSSDGLPSIPWSTVLCKRAELLKIEDSGIVYSVN